MTTVTLSLVSHTNVGKTTLARTLLGRDVGEVRDAPHVTEFADEHLLIESPAGDRLMLWDTPGFGDSVRLARRLRQSANPIGWLLAQVWDRWRDRAFWMSQQALRHVREGSDVLLYLVNASEPEAGYLAAEMQLLAWTGKPVIVLLNQLGVPRAADVEAAEVQAWRERLAPWPAVQAVLPLDAFARCWVQEAVLLQAVRGVLADPAGAGHLGRAAGTEPGASGDRSAAMTRLLAAWAERRRRQFDAAVAEIATSLARAAATREWLPEPEGMAERLRDWGTRLVNPAAAEPARVAQDKLAAALHAEVRASTLRLLALHGVATATPGSPQAGRQEPQPLDQVLARVAAQVQQHRRVPEGRAAMLGGAITGALAGLKADLATGGLTLGGGLLAGGLIGALGAAGLARGVNLVRGTDRSWVAFSAEALNELTAAALLRYLAVAHYGRGRGEWAQAEAPPHWPAAVERALAARTDALARLWPGRSARAAQAHEAAPVALAAALQPLLAATLQEVLAVLYPPPATSDNAGT
jgi:hypothetical protein